MAEHEHHITLAEAIKSTHKWQKKHRRGRHAWMLPRAILDEILQQPGCGGIRVYAGGVKGDKRMVWIGTDTEGNDLTDGVIAEECLACPPFCSVASPLLVPGK